MKQPKKTIDERLEALTMNLEILTADVHAMQTAQRAFQAAQEGYAERERKLRDALMIGIVAFMQALENGKGGDPTR